MEKFQGLIEESIGVRTYGTDACPSISQKIFRQIQIGLDLSKLFWIVPKNVFSLKSFSSYDQKISPSTS